MLAKRRQVGLDLTPSPIKYDAGIYSYYTITPVDTLPYSKLHPEHTTRV